MLVPTSTRGQHQSEDCDVGTSWESLQPQYDRNSFCVFESQLTWSLQCNVSNTSLLIKLTIIQTDNLVLRCLILDKPHIYSRF